MPFGYLLKPAGSDSFSGSFLAGAPGKAEAPGTGGAQQMEAS